MTTAAQKNLQNPNKAPHKQTNPQTLGNLQLLVASGRSLLLRWCTSVQTYSTLCCSDLRVLSRRDWHLFQIVFSRGETSAGYLEAVW